MTKATQSVEKASLANPRQLWTAQKISSLRHLVLGTKKTDGKQQTKTHLWTKNLLPPFLVSIYNQGRPRTAEAKYMLSIIYLSLETLKIFLKHSHNLTLNVLVLKKSQIILRTNESNLLHIQVVFFVSCLAILISNSFRQKFLDYWASSLGISMGENEITNMIGLLRLPRTIYLITAIYEECLGSKMLGTAVVLCLHVLGHVSARVTAFLFVK